MSYKATLPLALALALGVAGGVQAQGTTGATPASPTTTGPATTTTTGPAMTPSTAPATAPTAMTPNATNGAPVVSGTNSATNNAVNTRPHNNPGAPVAGANSFTKGEAQRRIADRGYGQVSDLKLDRQGIWRGTAKKDGHTVNVSMDYQGNVVAK